MGEIADALKRANDQRDRDRQATRDRTTAEIRRTSDAAAQREAPVQPPTQSQPQEPASPYTRALDLTEPFGPVHDEPERIVELEIGPGEGPYSPARAVLSDHEPGTAESFRHFALRVNREAALLDNRAIAIVSALRGEGKTTTACNLALALASIGGEKPTALVDLDLRRPSLAQYLGATPAVGIEAVLRGKSTLEQACMTTNFPYLDIYPVVRPTPQPHELLASDALAGAIATLLSRYHTVIIDTPPVLLVPDVELLLPHIGGAVVVVRSRQTRVDTTKQLLDLVPRSKLLGSFLNEARPRRHSKRYDHYYLPDESPEDERADP